MTPEEADKIVGRDERDDLIDRYAFDASDDDYRLPAPEKVVIEIRSLDFCQAIQDMAFDMLAKSKAEFMLAVEGDRSSEAHSASYKVVAMRELLRQLLPIRNGR